MKLTTFPNEPRENIEDESIILCIESETATEVHTFNWIFETISINPGTKFVTLPILEWSPYKLITYNFNIEPVADINVAIGDIFSNLTPNTSEVIITGAPTTTGDASKVTKSIDILI